MKLINFYEVKQMNDLLVKMGASLKKMNSSNQWDSLDESKLDELLRTGEVEIEIDEIETVDGVFEFKGQKVVVYIRDQYAQYYGNGYKYHLTTCNTISKAFHQKRNSRYVISLRTDGMFKINLMQEDVIVKENITSPLNVCKNCLESINFEGYSISSKILKNKIYQDFNLSKYFDLFRVNSLNKSLFDDEEKAPINTYNQDFSIKSRELKEKEGYRCKECGINMSRVENRKFSHVHHVDANKSNDHQSNLKVLCIECHSNKPGHERMKYTTDYTEFQRRKNNGEFG